jgi:hypothetical protein
LEESRVDTLHHRSPEVPKCETPKILKQAHQLDFRIPGVGGVKSRDSSSQEFQSAEMRNAKNPETGTSTGVSDTGSWRSQESRLFITGVPKCETPKILKQAHRPEFRILGVGGVKSRDSSSQESQRAEMKNYESNVWISALSPSVVTSSKSCREELEETSSISEVGTWRVETTHHRIPEMRNVKCMFRIGPWS